MSKAGYGTGDYISQIYSITITLKVITTTIAKQCIPHGRRKSDVPWWDKECETLYRSITRAPVGTDSDRAATSLLSRLGQKKQERREEAVISIEFSRSSHKAWRTINKLTGRSGRAFRQCPISANSIASQLVKNGAQKTGDRKSTRLVNRELSDLWKIPTPEGHSISEPFRPEELTAALRRLKPGRSPGLDSIFPEFIFHGLLSNLGFASSSLPACPKSKFQRPGEGH